MTPGNVVMALMIVIGAIIGAGGVGYLVGFYPVGAAASGFACLIGQQEKVIEIRGRSVYTTGYLKKT